MSTWAFLSMKSVVQNCKFIISCPVSIQQIFSITCAPLQAAYARFGYKKGELDNKNVSLLMPAPFNAQHDIYLQRYVKTGQPHIQDKYTQVMGLHKVSPRTDPLPPFSQVSRFLLTTYNLL